MMQRIRYRFILTGLLLVAALTGHTQVNSFGDQYLGNLFLVNPAIAGTGQYGTLSVISRQQWTGWDGAPASQSVTWHSKISKSKARFNPLGLLNRGQNAFSNVGGGAGFFHQSFGVFHLTGFHLDYSYHVYTRKGRLSLGLAPSIFQVGTSSLLLADPNDPYLQNPLRSYFIDFNAGAHYFTKTWYAGISVLQLTGSSIRFGDYGYLLSDETALNPDLARSAYAYGGYFFTLNRDLNLKLEPMALVKINGSDGVRLDASATVHLLDKFNAGVSWSTIRGMFVYTGVRLDNLSFRYLFEIPMASDVAGRYTSHMIQLSVNLGQPIE